MTTQQNISLPATVKAGGTHEIEISPDRGTTDLQDYIAQQTTHITEFDEPWCDAGSSRSLSGMTTSPWS